MYSKKIQARSRGVSVGIQVGSCTDNVGTQVNVAPHVDTEAKDLIDKPILDEDSSDDYSPLDELESELEAERVS
ncbi:hypothetical protein V5799_010010 [Amblyomma americanum]|uniref:Uncharacterized protein n=1 Tax=Amblyomma americanum TaxID=6943 RepID=A0AAQ4FAD6_AMBAM